MALVLNLYIGYITSQYHLIFDNEFLMVEYLNSGVEPSHWDLLFCSYTEWLEVESDDYILLYNKARANSNVLPSVW